MQHPQTDSAIGKIEWYNEGTPPLLDTNATIEIIGTGYNWAEGPVWVEALDALLFSDVPENKIYIWKNGSEPTVYLTPSGYTGTAARTGEVGSNGLALDKQGRLLVCQHGNRQVAYMNAPLTAPAPSFAPLAAQYEGKTLNSPNDVTTNQHNAVYFTDPIYGLPAGATDPERALAFEGVYKIEPDGQLTLLIDTIPRPNGIAFSPDEKTLYIGSSDEHHPAWYAYQLDENYNIQSGGLLLDARALKEQAAQKQGPDGLKVDHEGNLYAAGPDGINIISAKGERLGLIKIYGRLCSNVAFNTAKDVLYITADDVVLRVKLKH